MHNTTLLLYRNEDIYLDRPYKLNIPQSVDTLAELCQLLTSSIPLPDGCTQRGYRFLYTINGKALWRVRECIDSGVIVFSTTPGFLPRSSTVTVPTKTSSPPTPAMDISPDPRPVLGASPPIGTLEDDEHFVDRNYFNPAPTAAPLPLDEYDDFPYFSAPRNEEVATRKLFSEESARLSGGGKDYPSSFSRQQHQKSPSPVSGRSVVVGGKVYPLPPRPMFERIPETIVSKAQHPQTDYGRGLQLLLGRKWEAYRKQREIHPSERLCTEQYAQLAANLFQSDTFHPIISSSSQTNGAVVTISGPTGSGKSFSAAALVGEAVESYFGRDKLFYNYLLLPLDWSMFLSTEGSTAMGDLPGKLGCLWVTFPFYISGDD
ncbi:hypothetical protein ADEAN_000745900 [Angomonas deanei]|uniref:Doublecortin domain-containing protein n=1 Tax=Angomonas deanei TaxID=59799 RepID=A0A7G2CKL5_9TRYP|nr:hypothetical protein ADEAN_000745900 [Angomonas deanei]